MITKTRTMAAGLACAAGLAAATATVATPPGAFRHLTVRLPGAPVRIFGGRLFVTAMARHTPYSP